ncbi:GDT1-like protein 1, chloroplastic isoform X3 [Oryza brachyantha]|uniref:GDT1-like protein 1, chloroplastic isoform X3 n=1 Tax=Oryza brachyantha TaxID=4533 RepID=UPI001ADBD48E|nr:GDT1-like protein 1, chloroplastic isoform X3 [Oryza brachyantha]
MTRRGPSRPAAGAGEEAPGRWTRRAGTHSRRWQGCSCSRGRSRLWPARSSRGCSRRTCWGISVTSAQAFLLIFFSELGDRTFFIAALLAARNSGGVIFLGTFGALAVMTIVSVVLGRAFHYVDGIIPFSFGGTDFPVDDFLAVCLLVYYGVTTLIDAASGDEEKMNEEQEEAELAVSKFSGNGAGIMSAASTVASTFVLVFIAEWGDKSFFSTIALAAASSPLGVIAGSLAGHAVATLIAVLGGSLLGTFLSEKIIAYIGGSLFLAFAAVTLAEIVSS